MEKKHRNTFGKTYEEIFGFEKAKEMHLLRKSCRKEKYIPTLKVREKQSKSRKAFLENYSEEAYYNSSKRFLGKTYEEVFGEERGKLLREKKKGSRVERFGEEEAARIGRVIQEKRLKWFLSLTPEEANALIKGGYTSVKRGKRNDLGDQYFKSSWEANVARLFNYLGIKWKYEARSFKLKIGDRYSFYTPDFYLPEFDFFVEVKGWGSLDKVKLLQEQYTKRCFVISEKEYTKFRKLYSSKIPYWEK